MNSKHRVGGKRTVWTNYYMEKQGQGLMKTDGGFQTQHGWGGCPDAHQVWVLAQNIETGMDAQVHRLVIDGS